MSASLQKVFDSVPHRSLIEKLRHLNINVYVLRWITDFLTERRQCVGVEGATSLPLPVLSGVPQGSVLGPLLFIIYIDGLTNVLSNSSISLYADDLLLYRPIRPPPIIRLCRRMLMHWLTGFQLTNCSSTAVNARVCL